MRVVILPLKDVKAIISIYWNRTTNKIQIFTALIKNKCNQKPNNTHNFSMLNIFNVTGFHPIIKFGWPVEPFYKIYFIATGSFTLQDFFQVSTPDHLWQLFSVIPIDKKNSFYFYIVVIIYLLHRYSISPKSLQYDKHFSCPPLIVCSRENVP